MTLHARLDLGPCAGCGTMPPVCTRLVCGAHLCAGCAVTMHGRVWWSGAPDAQHAAAMLANEAPALAPNHSGPAR